MRISDWSSDVCSSDLESDDRRRRVHDQLPCVGIAENGASKPPEHDADGGQHEGGGATGSAGCPAVYIGELGIQGHAFLTLTNGSGYGVVRAEGRRVGNVWLCTGNCRWASVKREKKR